MILKIDVECCPIQHLPTYRLVFLMVTETLFYFRVTSLCFLLPPPPQNKLHTLTPQMVVVKQNIISYISIIIKKQAALTLLQLHTRVSE